MEKTTGTEISDQNRVPIVPKELIITFLILFTVPFWISKVGLYSYIGVEILIWILFAMAYNLVLGFTGLPSFCHGTFFGVGGYAMAIYQLEFNGESALPAPMYGSVSPWRAPHQVG